MIIKNISFFDSGQGGLTIWENIIHHFPGLNTTYLGDNARYPYGNKGEETILQNTSQALFWLARHHAGLIVVACGTASSVAVKPLNNVFKIPVIGIVEGFCQKALSLVPSPSRTIAVLGTRFTVKSETIKNELKSNGAQKIWQKACPLFVPLVEEGIPPGEIAQATSEMYLWDLPEDTDLIMLACTHFPRLAQSIAQAVHKRLNRTIIQVDSHGEWLLCKGSDTAPPLYLLDPSLSIKEQVQEFLKKSPQEECYFKNSQKFYCTDTPEKFSEVAHTFTTANLPKIQQVIFS